MLFGLSICCLKIYRLRCHCTIYLDFFLHKKLKSIRVVKKDISTYGQGERYILPASILGKALLISFVFPTDIVACHVLLFRIRNQCSVIWIK